VKRVTPKAGSDNKSRNAVTRTDHTNKGNPCIVIPGPRMLKIVVIKLILFRPSRRVETKRLKPLLIELIEC
jgi:hypothetical protein